MIIEMINILRTDQTLNQMAKVKI